MHETLPAPNDADYADGYSGACVYIPNSDLVVYRHMLPPGTDIRISREISAFKADGSIALAGEAWNNLLIIRYGDYERACLPAAAWGKKWSQKMLDNEIEYAAQGIRRMLEREREIADQRERLMRDEEARRASRKLHFTQTIFSPVAKPASEIRNRSNVMDEQGRLWQMVRLDNSYYELRSGDYAMTIEPETLLLPTTLKQFKAIKSQMRGVAS